MNEVQRTLDKLRSMSDEVLDELCRRHAVRVLTVFGSAVRDVPDPHDLDVGVIFEPGADHDVLGLLASLTDRLSTDRIDVLDAARASETARMRSIAEGEVLYENKRTADAMAAAAARPLYMETAPMRAAAIRSIGS